MKSPVWDKEKKGSFWTVKQGKTHSFEKQLSNIIGRKLLN